MAKKKIDVTAAPKTSRKELRQIRHELNVEKKMTSGSVFTRLRTKLMDLGYGRLTKSEFRNGIRLMRTVTPDGSQSQMARQIPMVQSWPNAY